MLLLVLNMCFFLLRNFNFIFQVVTTILHLLLGYLQLLLEPLQLFIYPYIRTLNLRLAVVEEVRGVGLIANPSSESVA